MIKIAGMLKNFLPVLKQFYKENEILRFFFWFVYMMEKPIDGIF